MSSHELKSILPKDYGMLKHYFALRPARTCESIVTNSFIWKDYYSAKYYVNEYGIVFIYRIDGNIFSSSPLCRVEDIAACVEDMRKFFHEEYGLPLALSVADGDTAAALFGDERYVIKEERDYFDYIYDAKKLASLSGKLYHKKKNHYNSFLKEYEGRYRTAVLAAADAPIITEFIDRWHAMRNIEDVYRRDDYEIRGIKELLEYAREIDMEMFGVFVDERLEAFSLATYIRDLKRVFVHVEKANPEIRGLYPFINREFLAQRFPEAEYVNREDDMGLPGLRQAKLSYNPVYMEKKYTIYERKI